ncbi:MAG: L-rhamnose isomerase [Clostridia bacterium]|nr:L-rhamnose isomerase [Clostridia bacterium]
MTTCYEWAKQKYAALGVDTDAAIEALKNYAISMHCWQGDDVRGFDTKEALSGGIQTTGNYPGRATTPEELMADMDKALSLIGGKHKINLHASYAIFEKGEFADRNKLEPKHFQRWVTYAKERGMGIDFNPTFFSHPMAASGLTLSSPDEKIRSFWVEHGKACIRISEYFANETGIPCVMNIWIPDGYKDTPADRMGPRARFAKSLDEILSIPYDKKKVLVCLESKVFGIGVESYTVGSAEFTMNYVAKNGLVPLMDNGHYHPTEVVSDKLSSMFLFNDKVALHVTRGVRWDSDHVVRLDDETREIAKELVASGRMNDVALALDFFDASINRVAAWVIGMRNMQRALLGALLQPHAAWKKLQDEGKYTDLLVMSEEIKSYPECIVWEEFCNRCGVPSDEKWFAEVKKYEETVLSKRA